MTKNKNEQKLVMSVTGVGWMDHATELRFKDTTKQRVIMPLWI